MAFRTRLRCDAALADLPRFPTWGGECVPTPDVIATVRDVARPLGLPRPTFTDAETRFGEGAFRSEDMMEKSFGLYTRTPVRPPSHRPRSQWPQCWPRPMS
eukprot:10868417-Lingulodinium_polyedra.AAC.1